MWPRLYVYLRVYLCGHVYVCTCVAVFVWPCLCMYLCGRVCVYVCGRQDSSKPKLAWESFDSKAHDFCIDCCCLSHT